MLDQVEKNDKKLSGYEKTSEINNGKKERKKLTREEKQKIVSWQTTKKLLSDLNTSDFSQEGWERHKDVYLQGKVSFENWTRYYTENKERVLSELEVTQYIDFDGETKKIPRETNKSEEGNPYLVFEKEGQALEFIKRQPLFYDKSGIWWLWDFDSSKFEMVDKTQILTNIKNCIGANVIASKERTEIINALEIVGREHMPKELSRQCMQFKNKIINIRTGDEYEVNPKLFATNPIPWSIGESEDTPTMDKLFEEWVGKEYAQTLYEILAYSACSDQFMQRMIALVGGGSNGKGTYIKLLKKFIGKANCTSSELKVLSDNIFETSALYKKLVCEMGEVSHDDLKSSNQIKKLSGEDDIRYCFKGKTPFTEESQTTCLINTNSLPVSRDKTDGFYRRWLIVDFPNQFPIKQGLIDAIPEKEFDNLALKCIGILRGMYTNYKFTNEGNIQERAVKYEERSNPVMKFVEDFCEEDYMNYTSMKIFSKTFNEYLKVKHLRSQIPKEIKKALTEEGFDVRKTTKFGVQDVYIIGLNLLIPLNLLSETSTLREILIREKGINGINGIKTNNQETGGNQVFPKCKTIEETSSEENIKC